MGLYFGRAPGTTWEDISPSITAREYVSALAAATDLLGEPGRDSGRPGSHHLGAWLHAPGIADLSERIRRRPGDEDAHRLLGLSHLAADRVRPAVKHLEIALRLARRDARGALGMTEALRLHCEAARLRLVLLRLYMKVGDVRRARALAREIQAAL
jgi:hypothetical protein